MRVGSAVFSREKVNPVPLFEGPGTLVCLFLVMIASSIFGQVSLEPVSTVNPAVISVPGESLVPAAIGVRTDRFGHSWNVERTGALGRVGSTMVNSGLVLSVNGQKFETFQPRMTKDGREFVIHGRPIDGLSGVQAGRRVRFMEETGALRYLELFFNGNSVPVTLSIELATSFSGNYKTSVTDRANIEPVMLGEGESGLLVTPGSSQANRAFLFVLCGPEASDKPTISTQSRYGLKFQYQLTLNPGETKVLAHVVSQAIVPRELDRKTLSKLFNPYSLEKIRHTIPNQFEDAIANGSVHHSVDELRFTRDTIESIGLERIDSDVLAMGDQTRLLGDARFGPIELETRFGKATIPADKVIALVGKNRGLRERVRVFLADGQIFSGEVVTGDIDFDMKGGGQMKVGFDKLDRLVIARTEADLPRANENTSHAMVRTWSGDQLKLEGERSPTFVGLTPWGELPFSLSELNWLVPAPDDQPGYQLRLKDGTECLVFLPDEAINLNSGYIGEISLNLNQLQAILPENTGNPLRFSNRIRLAGDQFVVGNLADETVQVASNGQVIKLSPGEIRRLTSLQDPNSEPDPVNPSFMVETWDGSKIKGVVRNGGLSVTVAEKNWEIPLTDIVELESAGPVLSGENRTRLTDLLVQLGDPDWTVREKATNELKQFGYRSIPMLRTELNQNPDPEVRRRIERVLSGFRE